jgi:hypothetical protein
MGSTLGLLLSVLTLATPPNPAPVRKLFVEFSGVCAFVPNPKAPKQWIVVFPNVSKTISVNGEPTNTTGHHMNNHTQYIKVWNAKHLDATGTTGIIKCTPTGKAKVCDLETLEGAYITVGVPEPVGAVGRSQTFDNDVISIEAISGEGKIDGLLDPSKPKIKSRVFVDKGKLIGIVNPLTQWDFNDGKGPRQIARAVLWEIDIPSANQVPVSITGKKADGTPLWTISLTYDESTVISIAQTDDEDMKIDDYYEYQPAGSPHHDYDFLLNYALLASWGANINGEAKVLCNGAPANCRHPQLYSSAVSDGISTAEGPPTGRKANCYMVKFPEQPTITPTPTP